MIQAAAITLVSAAGLWLAAAALGVLSSRRAGLRAAGAASALGGLSAVGGGVLLAIHGVASGTRTVGSNLVGAAAFRLDPLAATFIVLLGLVALAIGLFAPRYHRPERGTAIYLCVYNLALLASLGVLVAADATAFLVAWEAMTVFSYLLILRHHRQRGVARGAFLFVALGEVGFAMIVAAFAILAVKAGSLDLQTIGARSGRIQVGWRDAAFALALVGFGFKAGLVPLHIWLPDAHPVAPADGSGFLSGLVIKLGVYGIMLFALRLLGPGPVWWGVATMLLGAVTAVVGVLYAVIERDFKRLLAYHSIENIGIIVTAFGGALIFLAYRQAAIGTFLLIAALYHVLNHGSYKTLLFLEAGVIEHAAGTRDLDRLGGLIHRMPATSVITLIGILGIAGLPPLNGFVSEWMVFQGLFQAFRIQPLAGVIVVVAGAGLALSGGIAIMAFAHAYGISFLGMPRTGPAANAREERQPKAGPGVLAVACVALAIGAPVLLVAFDRIGRSATGMDIRAKLLLPHLTVIPGHASFAAFSPTYLAAFLAGVSTVPILIWLAGRVRTRGHAQSVPVWDSGIVAFKPRMQYTGTTFANPMRVTFDHLYRPDVQLERASDDPAGRSGPVHYNVRISPVFQRYLYEPVTRLVERLADLMRPLQSGNVNLYLLYVFLVVIVAYLAHLIEVY